MFLKKDSGISNSIAGDMLAELARSAHSKLDREIAKNITGIAFAGQTLPTVLWALSYVCY